MALNLKELLDWHEFPPDVLQRAMLREEDLQKIYDAHCAKTEELKRVGASIAGRLSDVRQVHSVKYRAKDPNGLIAKIINKKLEEPDREITPQNYSDQITDLIGVRALHLFKDHWPFIHEFVKKTWALHETPIVHYRKGDTTEEFDKSGFKVGTPHRDGYRSLHYIVEDACLAEIQVRTVFEEGWSEIDHHFRYARNKSRSKNHLIYDPYLLVFNELAHTADEMGTLLLKIRMQLRREIFGRQVIDALKADIEKITFDASQKKLLLNHLKTLEQFLTFSGVDTTVPIGYAWAIPDVFPPQLRWKTPDLRQLDPLLDQYPDAKNPLGKR